MANSVGTNLKNKVVVIKRRTHTGTTDAVHTRLFLCKDGNGCDPTGMGVKIFGIFLDNVAIPRTETATIHAQQDIEREATERETELYRDVLGTI